MSNIHYFLVSPDPSIRKKILKSQYNLLKHEKKLLYEEEPLKLGVLQCLVHRKRISEFLDKTVREFPALSDIEALKAQETLHNYTRIKSMLYYWTVGLSCFLGAYSILRPEFDWVYQQKVFYSKFSKSKKLNLNWVKQRRTDPYKESILMSARNSPKNSQVNSPELQYTTFSKNLSSKNKAIDFFKLKKLPPYRLTIECNPRLRRSRKITLESLIK